MAYINMDQKYKFLREVHTNMWDICEGLKNNLQPTAMNVHYYDKIKTNLSDDGHYSSAMDLLEQSEELSRKRKLDGNHHKFGQFIRKKGNLLFEAADHMGQIKEHFQAQFENKSIRSELLNKRGIRTMNMFAIRDSIDDIIFSDDVKKLQKYKKAIKHDR